MLVYFALLLLRLMYKFAYTKYTSGAKSAYQANRSFGLLLSPHGDTKLALYWKRWIAARQFRRRACQNICCVAQHFYGDKYNNFYDCTESDEEWIKAPERRKTNSENETISNALGLCAKYGMSKELGRWTADIYVPDLKRWRNRRGLTIQDRIIFRSAAQRG